MARKLTRSQKLKLFLDRLREIYLENPQPALLELSFVVERQLGELFLRSRR